MSKIPEFSSPVIKNVFRNQFAKFIAEFGKEHGVEFEFPRTISYDKTEFNLRLKVKLKNAVNKTTIPAMIFTPEGKVETPPAVGTKFRGKGGIYTVTGYKSNRPKFPVQAVSESGRKIKCSVEYVKTNKI